MSQKFLDGYVKIRIDIIKSFDRYVYTTVEAYGKMLSQFTKSIKQS